MAAPFGNYGLRLFAARLRRCMYAFLGLPHGLLEVAWNPKTYWVPRFKFLAAAWDRLRVYKNDHGLDRLAGEFYERSVFRTVSE